MPKKKKKKPTLSPTIKALMIILLLPVTVTVYTITIITWQGIRELPIVNQLTVSAKQFPAKGDDLPEEYIPIYQQAAEAYGIPWTLLAAHHRIETRFSTMETLVSPVGAEGHMQFMPCTFVGWSYPGCGGLGKGNIPDEDKTDPAVIEKYGGYGVDANGDGKADPYDLEDAVFSAANYLSKNGAAEGELEQAIFMYNRSDDYVQDILYYYRLYEERWKEKKKEEQ
ncbi:lytic transglycosylase domain-containing protein [Chungangia koreensis]|uniref:Lytic transglycosylase domain-containing protein n=1 Tax=Chungangia koreensis TaxID=752657 RepID=A0ABV8X727_9LACT